MILQWTDWEKNPTKTKQKIMYAMTGLFIFSFWLGVCLRGFKQKACYCNKYKINS